MAEYPFDVCFLINLDRAPERLEKAAALLEKLQIPFQRQSAVDGKSLSDADSRLGKFRTENFHNKGEIGCFLSHVEIWRRIANDPAYRSALVLEDDIDTYTDKSDLAARLQEIYQRMNGTPGLLYLGKCGETCNGPRNAAPTYAGVPYMYPAVNPLCTHAYIIDKVTAQQLLSISSYDTQVDQFLANNIKKGTITANAFHPSVFFQSVEFGSSLAANKQKGPISECSMPSITQETGAINGSTGAALFTISMILFLAALFVQNDGLRIFLFVIAIFLLGMAAGGNEASGQVVVLEIILFLIVFFIYLAVLFSARF